MTLVFDDIAYGMALVFDSDKEVEDKKMTIVYAIVGEQMERDAKRKLLFYVHEILEWNNRVEELMAEGGDAFAHLY